MTVEENKVIVRRFMAMTRENTFTVVDEIMDPDIINHDSGFPGLPAIAR